MRTIVYVDGFNFYYGRLKSTPFKWLDINKLFNEHLIHTIVPESELLSIKFFTADIKANFSRLGSVSTNAQKIYHNALVASSGNIEIIKGYYSTERSKPPIYEHPPNKDNTVDVWKLEEKQTDVKMALSIYHDVASSACDQIVICTNDTDLVPALELVKKHYSNVKIGAIIPTPKILSRSANRNIIELAHWSRKYITDAELVSCQLPNIIPKPNGRGVYKKPEYW